jgi:hypothetical protein
LALTGSRARSGRDPTSRKSPPPALWLARER